MPWKPQILHSAPHTWVLPRTRDMKCDVVAHLSEKLFDQTDETLWSQAVTAASLPGVRALHLLPDTHVGALLPVGGVLVTEDVLVLAASGYDISCGMISARVVGVGVDDVVDRKRRLDWVRAVEARVALGLGSHRPPKMPSYGEKDVERVFREGARALGVPEVYCERRPLPVGPDFDANAVEKARRNASAQLGSLGGGNHFCELQVDGATGEVFLMVHTGSRAFGWQTANHFFYRAAELRGMKPNQREQAWLGLEEPLGRLYLAHHNAAANYATANRWAILRGLGEATEEVFGATLEPVYEISHNLTQPEHVRMPDGVVRPMLVGRKGATRALPGDHVDLVGTPWARTGHPCIVPGSMYEGAALLRPRPGAYATLASVNHGSGRLLGRGQAVRLLTDRHHAIDEEMRHVRRTFAGVQVTGIVGNTDRTPLDECGHAYKALDDVLDVLVADDIAAVERRLWPVAYLKGMD